MKNMPLTANDIYYDFTPQAHARAGGYVIGAGVHMNIYKYIYI